MITALHLSDQLMPAERDREKFLTVAAKPSKTNESHVTRIIFMLRRPSIGMQYRLQSTAGKLTADRCKRRQASGSISPQP